MLQSFGILDGDKSVGRFPNAAYFVIYSKAAATRGVINYSDIFELKFGDVFEDKGFEDFLFRCNGCLWFIPVYATMTLKNGTTSRPPILNRFRKLGVMINRSSSICPDRLRFLWWSWKKLFEVLDINGAAG